MWDESMMNIMLKGILYGLSVFEIWLCYKFLFLFWVDEWKLAVYNKIIMAVTALGVGVMLEANREFILFSHIMFIVQVVVCCIPVLFIGEKNKILGLEIVTIFFSFTALLDYLFAYLMCPFIGSTMRKKAFYEFSEWKIGIYILTRIALFILYLYLKRHQDYLKEIGRGAKGILAISSLTGVAILRVYQLIFAYTVDNTRDSVVIQIMASLLIIIILLCLLLALAISRIKIAKSLECTVLKDELMEANYRQLGEQIAESRETMHDMKNHMRVLKEYCKEGDIGGIEAYLQKIETPICNMDKIVWTQSEILNLILNQKKAEAEKKHIKIDIMTGGVNIVPLKDNEVCSLFGNLLDNAIEACEKMADMEPWIKVELQQRKQMLFIKIANSAVNPQREVDGEFQSTKQDKDIHGLGLKSVRRIVERNNGDIRFEVEKDSFTVYITLFIFKEGEVLWKEK